MAELNIVAESLEWPEGPVWMEDGSIILVETAAGRVVRIDADGSKQVVAEPGDGPNGLAIGPDKGLYACNNGGMVSHRVNGLILATIDASPEYETGRIERIDVHTGRVERLYEAVDGRKLVAPNDIVFDAHGGFWFSDTGKRRNHSVMDGGVFYAKADGSGITRVLDRLSGANGIGLSPDGSMLYVAATFDRQLLAYEITAPGELDLSNAFPAPGRVVASFPGRQTVDSLAIDAEGGICVGIVLEGTGIGTVDPVSGAIDLFQLPDLAPTNICFGGADMQDAWITLSASGRLAKIRWDRPGLRLNYYA